MRLAGAIFALAMLAASAARADQMEDVAQIICVPEAGYFSLDIRKVDDIDIPAINKGLRFDRSALVWPAMLKKSYSCKLGEHSILATAVDWTAHSGDCVPKAGMSISISYDNKSVACLNDNEEIEDRRQSLTLTQHWGAHPDGALIEHCVALLDSASEQGTLHCETTVLGAMAQGKKT